MSFLTFIFFAGEIIIFNMGSFLILSDHLSKGTILYICQNYYGFIPSGANKQKIKKIDHRKRNARADKCNLLTEIPFEQAVDF